MSIVIAPASANTIAKLAAGLADNLLSSCALAAIARCSRAGDEQPHVRASGDARPTCRRCASAGSRSSSPTWGALASKGEQGVGRLAEPARLLEACEQALAAAR